MLRKLIEKIRGGLVRDIIAETRWIYGYAERYRRGILLYILLGLVSAAAGLGSGVVSKHLIDAVTGHQAQLLVQFGLMYALFGFGKPVLTALTRRMSAKLSVQATNEIQADVFEQFLTVDWQASLDYHSGDLLSRINSDVTTVSNSILGWIPSLIVGLIQFLGILAVILYYDPTMALFALLSTPVTVLLSQSILMNMRRYNQQTRAIQAELTSFTEEALQNLQAIKSFHLNDKFLTRLEQLQKLYRDTSLDYNLFTVKNHLLLSCVGFVTSGLCFGWGVYRLWGGHISFGTMVLFIQMAGLLSGTFSTLVGLIPSAISATVSAQRIMTILQLPHEDLAVSPQARQVLEQAPAHGVGVHIEDVCFDYRNGREVLHGVSMQAAPGEIIGIVSPSGGGKTTLIRMLLGLMSPDSGRVMLESGGTRAELSPCLRPLITYVAQEKVVFSGTIADCLRMSDPTADDTRLQQALEQACAWDFVRQLPGQLKFPLGERGRGLSEGQIQRLAIARALLSSAPVMLLDEATSALDLATERSVVRNMLSDPNRTVLLTTHRPTVLLSCTRVYSIQNGRARVLSREEILRLTQTP